MISVLQAMGRGALEHHPFLGKDKLKQIRQALASVDPSNKDLICTLHFRAGLKEARLGNIREAIAELQTAQDLISQTNFGEDRASYLTFQLGVAYLRMGETENCCISGGPESCIVPIGPAGVHLKKEGSQKAIEYFLKILESGSDSTFAVADAFPNSAAELEINRAAIWLLNVAHMTLGTYPDGVPKEYLVPESAFQSTLSFPKFQNVAQGLGLNTFDLCGGVICDDFDNDGNLDIVTSSWDPTVRLNFFRNKGDGSFENLSESAGLTGICGGLNINQTDFNNDGHLDIFIMRGAWLQGSGRMPNSLLRNNGDGTFTDITYVAGLAGQGLDFPTQASQWGDYDADGDLDLFIGNEHNEKIEAPCQLFRNNGDETFTNVAKLAGVENRRITKGAAFGDYDNDGDLDLFLSNLREANRLYRNQGDGTFVDVAEQSGVTKPLSSFPTWFFDFNNDGNLDLFVTSYTGTIDSLVDHYSGREVDFEPSRLYQGDGNGKFTNVSVEQKLNVPMLAMGANFGDLNNDGFLDFYLGTGSPEYESLTPNLMFLNQGGSGFADVTMAAGFGHLQKGHGIAFADLDNDGDAEVFEQMGGAVPGDKFGNVLFDNPGFGNNWIAIQLVGTKSNRAAIGAKIEVKFSVEGQDSQVVYRDVNSGGSFGSNSLRQTIGIGKADTIEEIKVHWPTTGETQIFRAVAPNQFCQIVEGQSRLEKLNIKAASFNSAEK